MKNLSAIILLFIANSISGIAQGISMIAIPWYFARQNEMEQIWIGLYPYEYYSHLLGTLQRNFYRSNTIEKTYFPGHHNQSQQSDPLLNCWILAIKMSSLPWFLVAFVFMFTFFNYNVHYPNPICICAGNYRSEDIMEGLPLMIEIQGQLIKCFGRSGCRLYLLRRS